MNDLQVIGSKIMTLPDRPPFMLDRDLAMVYGTTTKRINEAVKRNPDRFPEDFVFQLKKSEADSCDCDRMFEVADCDLIDETFKVADCDLKKNRRGKHIKYLPYGFTREGCNMLSTVLTSPTAIARSIQIIRTFSAIERYGNTAFEKLDRLANFVSKMDERTSALENLSSTFTKQTGKKTSPVMVGQHQPRYPMGERFVSAIEELMRSKRVQIMRHFSEDISISNFTTIGFYKDGDPRYVYLFPNRTMDVIRRFFFKREDLSLNLSTNAMGKQLVEEGYIVQPQAYSTFKVRIPGGGRKNSPKRVWKFKAKKFKSERFQNGNLFSTCFPEN